MNIDEAIKWYSKHQSVYKVLSEKVSEIIKEVLDYETLEYYTITKREKGIDSFREKLKDEKYEKSTDIKDLAGIRVITYVESDAQKIADIVEKLFDIDSINSIDKSKALGADKVGYRSMHYIAKFSHERCELPEFKKFSGLEFEIQIRTILQHAWAEIEHDRNYKYSGVLPINIKRRFSILAGVLELADKEFDQISLAIDSYKAMVAEKSKAGDLDIKIDSTSIREFLNNRFQKAIKLKYIKADLLNDIIIKELRDFGITTLSDLDKIILEDFENRIIQLKIQTNFIGLVRMILVLEDRNSYFEKSWKKKNWNLMGIGFRKILQSYSINFNQLAKKYGFELG